MEKDYSLPAGNLLCGLGFVYRKQQVVDEEFSKHLKKSGCTERVIGAVSDPRKAEVAAKGMLKAKS